MRQIKFRAWDSRNNEMVFSEGTDCFYINTKGVLFMYAIPKSESGLETIYHKSYDVDLFTGLQDKNGVDIYEKMEIDGLYNVEFKDGSYILIDISNGDTVLLYNYIYSRDGNVKITKCYTGI